MDAASTQAEIDRLDAQIQAKNDQIESVTQSIKEAEEALESGNQVKAEFEAFIQNQRRKNETFSAESIIHAFSEMIQEAVDLLSGHDYSVAQHNSEEMIRVVQDKKSSLESEKETLQHDLNWLKSERSRCRNELEMLEEGTGE